MIKSQCRVYKHKYVLCNYSFSEKFQALSEFKAREVAILQFSYFSSFFVHSTIGIISIPFTVVITNGFIRFLATEQGSKH